MLQKSFKYGLKQCSAVFPPSLSSVNRVDAAASITRSLIFPPTTPSVLPSSCAVVRIGARPSGDGKSKGASSSPPLRHASTRFKILSPWVNERPPPAPILLLIGLGLLWLHSAVSPAGTTFNAKLIKIETKAVGLAAPINHIC